VLQYQARALVAVPGGQVNVAGGNLLIPLQVLRIDTWLGSEDVSAVYNAATNRWTWSFDLHYDGSTLQDASGAALDAASVAPGAAIPGTTWVVLDASRVKTKGGLVHEFDASGRLVARYWASSAYPRVVYTSQIIAGEARTTAAQQCTAPGTCTPLLTFGYDTAGHLVSIVDRAGRQAELTYVAGQLASLRDPLEVAQGWPGHRFTYTGSHLTRIDSSDGETVAYSYNGARLASAQAVGMENPTWQLQYEAWNASEQSFATRVTNPEGAVTRLRYSAAGEVLSVHQPTGELTAFTWSAHRVVRMEDPGGLVWTLAYTQDDLTTLTEPSGNVTHFLYAPNATDRSEPRARPLLSATDSLGLIEARQYDTQGRLVAMSNGEGDTTSMAYDDSTQMVRELVRPNGPGDPDGVVADLSQYGEDGHPRTLMIGQTQRTQVYDAVGNLLSGVEPSVGGLSLRTPGFISRSFDPDRNVESVVLSAPDLPNGTVAQGLLRFERRSDGRILRIYHLLDIGSTSGHDVEFVYDALGRLSERREKASQVGFPVWQSTRFEWSPAGRMLAMERPNGMRTERSFDAAGRVRDLRHLRSGVLESSALFSYVDGRLDQIKSSDYPGAELYSYDSAGRVASIRYPHGEQLLRSYDLRSRVTSEDYGFFTLEHQYDLANRRTQTSQGGNLLSASSFAGGRLSERDFGNGVVRSFAYDPATGGLVHTEAFSGTAQIESTDLSGLVLSVSSTLVDQQTRLFGALPLALDSRFDLSAQPGGVEAPRLDTAARNDIDHPQSIADFDVYHYDSLGNLLSVYSLENSLLLNSDFSYNAEHNRLLSVTDSNGSSVHSYSYDAAGYTIRRDGVDLSWAASGRIASIESVVQMQWDALGRLVSRTVNGQEQKTLFGGVVEADAQLVPTALDLGDVRLDLRNGTHLYRHMDFRNNVEFTTDDSGQVRAHYRYSGYGVVAVDGNPGTPEEDASFAQGHQFAGLTLLGARLYDSDAARFLSPDPIYQMLNQYAYVLGDPVNFWDPGGMISQSTASLEIGFLTGLQLIAGLSGALMGDIAPFAVAAIAGLEVVKGSIAFRASKSQAGGAGQSDGTPKGGTTGQSGGSADKSSGAAFAPDTTGDAGFLARQTQPSKRGKVKKGGSGGGSSGLAFGGGGFGAPSGGGGCAAPLGMTELPNPVDALLLFLPWLLVRLRAVILWAISPARREI